MHAMLVHTYVDAYACTQNYRKLGKFLVDAQEILFGSLSCWYVFCVQMELAILQTFSLLG